MIEKSIKLEGIDPIHIYGANNSNLNKLKEYKKKFGYKATTYETAAENGVHQI